MQGFVWMGRFVPMYGLMILIGVLSASLFAWMLAKRYYLDRNHLLVLEAYGLLGGMVGAKLLFFLIHWRQIEWNRIFDGNYFKMLMSGGFVFYGGLIMGMTVVCLAGKLHKIHVKPYLELAIPCLPIAHGFGRIGCYFAGCCYGIPYEGPFQVVYHASEHMPVYAPLETPLFPIQLLEALINFGIGALLVRRVWKKGLGWLNVYLYLLLYGISRFFLEFLRYDFAERGGFFWFSTSQWVSICIILVSILLIWKESKEQKKEGIQ